MPARGAGRTRSVDDEKCPHCGHILKEVAKQEEAERKEEAKDEGRDEPKKAVSIRKIIRRK